MRNLRIYSLNNFSTYYSIHDIIVLSIVFMLYIILHYNLFIHISSRDIGCFHPLGIINNAAISIGVQISFWVSVFISFGYILRSGIAGPYGNSIFNFRGKFHIVFHSDCANLCPTNSTQGLSFLHIHVNICYLLSLWWWLIVNSCPNPKTCLPKVFYYLLSFFIAKSIKPILSSFTFHDPSPNLLQLS